MTFGIREYLGRLAYLPFIMKWLLRMAQLAFQVG